MDYTKKRFGKIFKILDKNDNGLCFISLIYNTDFYDEQPNYNDILNYLCHSLLKNNNSHKHELLETEFFDDDENFHQIMHKYNTLKHYFISQEKPYDMTLP